MKCGTEMGGLGLRSLDALAKHIAELTVIKQERMKELVGEVRDSLTEVWDAMRLSDESRRLFQPLFSEVFDDQALQSHEERLSSDKSRLEKMQPLIKMVERREQIRAEETAMIAAQADPNRLLGRGRGAAQALKQEEKVRNMVSKELPKVTERLRAAIVDYEASEGCPFELSGRSVTEALAEEDAAAALAKQESARSRGRSVPASDRPGTASKTPGPNALNQSLNASVSSVSSALRERPASARGAGGVTPGSRLKAAAKSVIAANKGARPASAAPTSENTNPQKGDNLPTSLLQPPSSRLKAPGTTRTVLKFDQETTHVISPRTGLPKRMITPLQAKE
uniref:Uncharacterized protein n=1 Tax=Hemiselmis andersenii TaxID=464988 RepID=A0A7S1GVU0_HEMAN